jgi:hypothetical protein
VSAFSLVSVASVAMQTLARACERVASAIVNMRSMQSYAPHIVNHAQDSTVHSTSTMTSAITDTQLAITESIVACNNSSTIHYLANGTVRS